MLAFQGGMEGLAINYTSGLLEMYIQNVESGARMPLNMALVSLVPFHNPSNPVTQLT
jgi:hypothetical protein